MIEPPRPPAAICGTVALAVCHAPVRLTSRTSCHALSPSSVAAPSEKIPALATTMSRRPNSATPSLTAADSESRSRTSACRMMARRPGPLNQLDRLVEVVVRCEVVVQARYVLTDVHADDVSATASQSQRVTSTLCACDSCDERDLAVESPHRRFLISRRQLEVCRPQHRLQVRRLTTRPERKQSLLAYQQPVFAGTAVLISAPISRASAPAAEDITPEN